jgi:hypothetical protein
MTILYIADADESSTTAGSVRGRAVKSFLERTYRTHYISLSDSRMGSEQYETLKPTIFRKMIKALKPVAVNRSFRSIDSSIFKKSFFANIIHIVRLYNENRNCRLIYCSYKPSAAIWLGLVAKILMRRPLLVEYRDLMSAFGDRDISTIGRILLGKLDRFTEVLLLKFIDEVIVVSNTQGQEFKATFNKECAVIMNGIDGEISNLKPELFQLRSDQIVKIGYAGQLSKRRKLSCLSTVSGEYALELMSKESPYEFGLPPSISCKEYGYLKKNEMSAVLRECDCFLLIEGTTETSKGNLPSKVFEYMQYGKPILFSGNIHSDVALILKSVGLLIMLPNDGTSINLLSELRNVSNSFDPSRLSEYSRSNQLLKLQKILDEYYI